jgi:hypothetical protein
MTRPVPPLPGVDLAPLIRGEWGPGDVIEADGSKRQGVLFITDDERADDGIQAGPPLRSVREDAAGMGDVRPQQRSERDDIAGRYPGDAAEGEGDPAWLGRSGPVMQTKANDLDALLKELETRFLP